MGLKLYKIFLKEKKLSGRYIALKPNGKIKYSHPKAEGLLSMIGDQYLIIMYKPISGMTYTPSTFTKI